jgi:hypothetical protein
MAFHTFQTGGKPPSSLTVPAQTNAPASEERSVPGALVPGGATVTTIPPHHAFSSLTLSSEAEKPNESAQFYAAMKGRLIQGEKPSAEMLQQAIKAGNRKAVSLLLKNGGDPNAAIDNCSPDNFVETVKVIDLLVKHGADINRRNSAGNTLLHEACKLGDVASVKRLVKHGANPLKDNKDSTSALCLAYKFCPEGKLREVLRALAGAGAVTVKQMQAWATTYGRWDVLAWVFAQGLAYPSMWTAHSGACPPELLKHLDDCFKEASKNMDQRVQKNCVVTIAHIMAWRGVESQPLKLTEEAWAGLSRESLAMIRDFAKEKIDIPEKARDMLREWISIAPEMEGTFAECAKTIKGRNPLIL